MRFGYFYPKYFQTMARFPDSSAEIPENVIIYVASQLKVDASLYSQYNWQGRSIKNHRAEIRELFGFRTATMSDSEEICDWLIGSILPNEQRFEALEEQIYQRFRLLQIEPPTSKQVERLIRSAISQYESNFCHHTFTKVSKENMTEIDILLSTEESDNEADKQDSPKLKTSEFTFLKTDPGPVGLGSFLTEIEKLKRIRTVGLPPDLSHYFLP